MASPTMPSVQFSSVCGNWSILLRKSNIDRWGEKNAILCMGGYIVRWGVNIFKTFSICSLKNLCNSDNEEWKRSIWLWKYD